MAHIGAIEELVARGYEIKAISGSSIGAAVGGLYAAGKLDIYKEWMLSLDRKGVFYLFDFAFSSQGFLKGERVFVEMEKLMGDHMIEDFDIPFTAVATDLKSKKEVWFRSGSLFKAVRASAAIPTILTPVYTDNQILVDGGVSNPIPIEAIKAYSNDLVVVVNINSAIAYEPLEEFIPVKEPEAENEYLKKLYEWKDRYFPASEVSIEEAKSPPAAPKVDKPSFIGLLNKTIDLMEDRLIELSLYKYEPDIVISVSRDVCGIFEFYKTRELIEAGRRACKLALDEYETRPAKTVKTEK
jgi:NTE family protein